MNRDVGGRKLALAVGDAMLWSGDRRRLLRKRRITFRPEAPPRQDTALLRLID
jgi:hypothetical protein